MQYNAIYYNALCVDTEQWHWLYNCVCITTSLSIIDIISYYEYKKNYSTLPLIEKQGFHIPAFINAHTHLDNVYLHGKTTLYQGFYQWLLSLLALRKENNDIKDYCITTFNTTEKMLQDTAYIATIASAPWLTDFLRTRSLPHKVLYESIGTTPLIPEYDTSEPYYTMAYAGHALYSTSPHVLQHAKTLCTTHALTFSIHLAEHEEEYETLQGKENEFALFLQERLLPEYKAPKQSPVAYAYSLGLLDNNTLAVHCVHCSENDIAILQKSGATICLCPRSNTYIGVGIAKAKEFYQAGIPLCIATDGLASNSSLSMWEEALYAMNLYGFTLRECIPMMTIQPARILGIDAHFGKIQKGYYPKTTQIPEICLPIY